MARYKWFSPIESIFYEAQYDYDLSEWSIEPMPNDVDTHRTALEQGRKHQGWPFRTHNAKGTFKCHNCGKKWKSSYTTVIWRARWSTGTVQITIEKQGCQRCNRACQGFLINEDAIEFTVEWICRWILDVFYNIIDENTNNIDDEPEEIEESTAPHDIQRCEAGRKGTCTKCNEIRRRR